MHFCRLIKTHPILSHLNGVPIPVCPRNKISWFSFFGYQDVVYIPFENVEEKCMKALNLLPVVVALTSWGADQQTLLHPMVFRLDALALSVIATATWLGGWLAGCHTPVLYQHR